MLLRAADLEAVVNSSGSKAVDEALGGGYPCGVVELCGEAGTGKTTWALLALRAAQKEGRGVYISSEQFPSSRYRDLTQSSKEMDALVQEVRNTADLDRVVCELERLVRGTASGPDPVRLIVLDNIAALYRSDSIDKGTSRTKHMFHTMERLKRLCKQRVTILVINQVHDVVEEAVTQRYMMLGSNGEVGRTSTHHDLVRTSGRLVSPSLGLVWSSFLNVRLLLSRSSHSASVQRHCSVAFAPHLSRGPLVSFRLCGEHGVVVDDE